MSDPGVNVPPREDRSAEARGSGAAWVRLVLTPDADPLALPARYARAGLKVLAVLARESFPTADYGARAAAYAGLHGRAVAAWQIGNEPDLDSPSSWTLDPLAYGQLVRACAQSLRHAGPSALIVGAGMASGDPAYYARSGALPALDGVAVHPYGQDADAARAPTGNFGRAGDLVGRYAALGKPVWVTEFGTERTRTPEGVAYVGALARQLGADPRVRVALHFCLLDSQVAGFGLLDDGGHDTPAMRAYRSAIMSVDPDSLPPAFKLGFAAYAAAHPEVGKPLENEHYLGGDPRYSLQMTENGVLVYAKAANHVQFLSGKG